jgi:hypothetical protein
MIIGYYYAGLPLMILVILKCGNLLFVYVIHSNAGSKDRQFYQSLSKFEILALKFQQFFQERGQMTAPLNPHDSQTQSLGNVSENITQRLGKRISTKRLLMAVGCALVIATLCTLLSLYVLTPDHKQYTCEFKDTYLYTPMIIILVFIICPSLLICIRKVDDNLGLRREMTVSLCVLLVCYSLLMARLIFNAQVLNVYVGAGIYMIFFFVFFSGMIMLRPALQTFKIQPRLDKNPESFKAMLHHKELRQAFQKALVKDFCTENLVFYMTVEKIKAKESQSLHLAELMNQFFTPGGEYELNLPSKVIKQARTELNSPDIHPIEVLERVQGFVFQMMYENNYAKFLQMNAANPTNATEIK